MVGAQHPIVSNSGCVIATISSYYLLCVSIPVAAAVSTSGNIARQMIASIATPGRRSHAAPSSANLAHNCQSQQTDHISFM